MYPISKSSNTLDISNGLKSQKCQFLFALAIILSLGIMAYEIWNFVQGTQTLSDLGIVHTLLTTTLIFTIVSFLLWQKNIQKPKTLVEQSRTIDVQTSPPQVSPISPKAEMPERKIQVSNGVIIFQTNTDILDRPSPSSGLHFRIDDPNPTPTTSDGKNTYVLFSGNNCVVDSRYSGHKIHFEGESLCECSGSKYTLETAILRGIKKVIYTKNQNSGHELTEIDHLGNEEVLYLDSGWKRSIFLPKKSSTLAEASTYLNSFIAEPTFHFFPKKAIFYQKYGVMIAWEHDEKEKFTENAFLLFPASKHHQKIQCVETMRFSCLSVAGQILVIRYLINGIFLLHASIRMSDSQMLSCSINSVDEKATIIDVKKILVSKMEEIFRESNSSLKQFPPGPLAIVANYYLT